MRHAFALIAALLLCSCAAPPQTADPRIPSREVRTDLFTAPEVRVHRFSYTGARIPDPAFHAAIATVERHLGRSITVIDHGEQTGGWGDHGPMAPIQDAGRAISAADVTAAGGTYRLATPDAGILGVIDLQAIPDWEAAASGMLPLVEPGTIIVVEIPGSEDGSGVTGFAAAIAVEPGPTRVTGTVVLNRSAIHRRSNLFVSESKLGQWTLTHEIGHVLSVPATNTHIWHVPGLGAHCTHPECVMYTGLDWRVVVTGMLKGWPMDCCDLCADELKQARTAQAGSLEAASASANPP